MMAIRITLSKNTCLLLGAGLGVTMAFIIPSSYDADDKIKQKNNDNKFKNSETNTIKIDEEKPSNFYGDKTMSEILEKAKLGIRKVWDEGWRIIFLNSKNSSTLSSDVFVDAQSRLTKSDGEDKGTFDPSPDSCGNDSLSTIYTPVGKLSVSQYSSLKRRFKKGFNEMAKGYKRSNTSKNDRICKNYPKHASTLIEAENEITTEENVENENTGTVDEFNSNNGSDKDKKLVLNFRTPFSPVVRVFQAIKRFKQAKKRTKERSDTNIETNNSNGIQEVVGT